MCTFRVIVIFLRLVSVYRDEFWNVVTEDRVFEVEKCQTQKHLSV